EPRDGIDHLRMQFTDPEVVVNDQHPIVSAAVLVQSCAPSLWSFSEMAGSTSTAGSLAAITAPAPPEPRSAIQTSPLRAWASRLISGSPTPCPCSLPRWDPVLTSRAKI